MRPSCSNSWIASAAPSRGGIAQQDRARQRVAGGDQHGGGSAAVGFFEERLETSDAVVRQKRLVADADVAPVEAAFGAAAGDDARFGRGVEEQLARLGCLDDDLRERVVRAAFGRRPERQYLVLRGTVRRQYLKNAKAARGQRAGLVEDDRVDLGAGLQHRPAAHQDAAPRQPADRRDHGGGRRQNQRAGAADDQHRHRAQPVAGEILRGGGGQQQRRQKIARVVVGEANHRRLALLGFLDQVDDARDRAVFAGVGDRECAADRGR